MKKISLLITLLLICAYTAQAQFSYFGAKGGGGFTTAVGQDAPSGSINYSAGLHAGIMYQYQFISNMGVQTELLYSRKGFVFDDYLINANESLAGDVYLDYLELPMLLKVRSGGLFAEAGPYVGYLLRGAGDVNRFNAATLNDPEPVAIGAQEIYTDNFRSFDYGYAIGGGLILDNGFFVSLRHTGGLRSFSAEDLSRRNLVWQLSIGFLMPVRVPVGLR